MPSHVFVTAKYLDRCIETGLFGVKNTRINFLANVASGDRVFLLEAGSGRLAGPLFIDGSMYFSASPVWEHPTDRFTYRVKLVAKELFSADVSTLWGTLLRRAVHTLFTFTTIQRSVISLFPGEGEEIAATMAASGTPLGPLGHYSENEEMPDLFQRDTSVFKSEARLEASLLLARGPFLNFLKSEGQLQHGKSYYLLNQVTIPGLNYNIDLLALAEDHAVIVELKKEAINQSTCEQVRRYAKYFEAVGIRSTLVAIGSSAKYEDPLVTGYLYNIDREARAVVLSRQGKSWALPISGQV
jgi:hypothetical protein